MTQGCSVMLLLFCHTSFHKQETIKLKKDNRTVCGPAMEELPVFYIFYIFTLTLSFHISFNYLSMYFWSALGDIIVVISLTLL